LKSRHTVGIILVILGTIFLLDELNIFYFGDIFRTYWPLLIILYGVGILFDKTKSKLFGAIVVLFGVLVQLSKLDYLDKGIMNYFLPSLLILIGINLIFESEKNKKKIIEIDFDKADFEKNITEDNFITHTALFSGLDLYITNDDFMGAKLNAIFGGIKLDLMNINPKRNIIVIDSNAIFGSIDVKIPSDWNVKVEGTPLFGEFSNKQKRTYVEGAPTVVFRGLALFGEIKID